ncbi:hypothetical protein CEK71_20960 [Methylovulum psychrotolerans]|uniref:Uncharacterized protein n=1 Tax=Methylovulum psychrotolerans TaxID=1704499 RepID=A0A1Z4C4C7_9GAMM|nr:hypothetical protein CEK71_20960 [Methylovulum psychrotolerans]
MDCLLKIFFTISSVLYQQNAIIPKLMFVSQCPIAALSIYPAIPVQRVIKRLLHVCLKARPLVGMRVFPMILLIHPCQFVVILAVVQVPPVALAVRVILQTRVIRAIPVTRVIRAAQAVRVLGSLVAQAQVLEARVQAQGIRVALALVVFLVMVQAIRAVQVIQAIQVILTVQVTTQVTPTAQATQVTPTAQATRATPTARAVQVVQVVQGTPPALGVLAQPATPPPATPAAPPPAWVLSTLYPTVAVWVPAWELIRVQQRNQRRRVAVLAVVVLAPLSLGRHR